MVDTERGASGGTLFSRRSDQKDSLGRSSSECRSSAGGGAASMPGLRSVASAARELSKRFTSNRHLKSSLALGQDDSTQKNEHKGPSGTGKIIKDLGDTVTTVIISNDNRLFAAGSINKKAVVCEVATGKEASCELAVAITCSDSDV